MQSELAAVNRLVSELCIELENQQRAGKVLCKCDDCEKPDVPVWERSNFTARGNAALHLKNQRVRKRRPPVGRGSRAQQSFWKLEDVVWSI